MSQLLIGLNKTQAELAKFRKYGGASMLQCDNERLQGSVSAATTENAAFVDELETGGQAFLINLNLIQAKKPHSRELIKCNIVCTANRQDETTSP